MRYLFPLLLLATQVAHAQCCPYVQPVEIVPANPTSSDDIRLVFHAATGSQGRKISSQLNRTGSAFTFTACYYGGMLTMPQAYVDTVRVGQLPPGSYTIDFIAKQSSDPQQCTEVQRNGNLRTFQVSSLASGTRTSSPVKGLLYPVPATGRQLTYSVTDKSNVTAFQLYDATGRECFSRATAAIPYSQAGFRLDLPALPAGTYTLRVQRPGLPPSTHRMVLQ